MEEEVKCELTLFPLTHEDCIKMLRNRGINANVEILEFKYDLSATLCNELTSNHDIFRIHIKYETDASYVPESLTVLVKSPLSSQRYNHFRDIGIYDKEYILYSRVFPEILKLSKDNFTPRFYGGNEEIPAIAMEDLYAEGYQKGISNRHHYKAVFKYLAKMHALSMVLNKTTPISNILPTDSRNSENYFIRGINQIIKNLTSDLKEKYHRELKVLENTTVDKITSKTDSNHFKALIHGNLWYPNILFKCNKGEQVPEKVAFINFEEARWDNPVLDLWCFFITNVDFFFYLPDMDPLLEIYADTMNDIFKSFDMDICSLVNLKRNFYDNYLYALCICGNVHPIVTTIGDKKLQSDQYCYASGNLSCNWFEYFVRNGFFEKGRPFTKKKR